MFFPSVMPPEVSERRRTDLGDVPTPGCTGGGHPSLEASPSRQSAVTPRPPWPLGPQYEGPAQAAPLAIPTRAPAPPWAAGRGRPPSPWPSRRAPAARGAVPARLQLLNGPAPPLP